MGDEWAFGTTRGLLCTERRPIARQLAHGAGSGSGGHGTAMSRRNVVVRRQGGLFSDSWPTGACFARLVAFPRLQAQPGRREVTRIAHSERVITSHILSYTCIIEVNPKGYRGRRAKWDRSAMAVPECIGGGGHFGIGMLRSSQGV